MARTPNEDRATVRTKVIPVIRVTEAEEEALKQGAAEDEQSLSAWLRELGLKRRRAQEAHPRTLQKKSRRGEPKE